MFFDIFDVVGCGNRLVHRAGSVGNYFGRGGAICVTGTVLLQTLWWGGWREVNLPLPAQAADVKPVAIGDGGGMRNSRYVVVVGCVGKWWWAVWASGGGLCGQVDAAQGGTVGKGEGGGVRPTSYHKESPASPPSPHPPTPGQNSRP